MNISDSKRPEIRELANEILQARTDDEFNEACRAIKAVIEAADCRGNRCPHFTSNRSMFEHGRT